MEITVTAVVVLVPFKTFQVLVRIAKAFSFESGMKRQYLLS